MGHEFEVETMDNWVDVFKVNAIAPFFVIKAFLGLLTKGGQEFTSSVINISSCVAVMSSPFAPATVSYPRGSDRLIMRPDRIIDWILTSESCGQPVNKTPSHGVRDEGNPY